MLFRKSIYCWHWGSNYCGFLLWWCWNQMGQIFWIITMQGRFLTRCRPNCLLYFKLSYEWSFVPTVITTKTPRNQISFVSFWTRSLFILWRFFKRGVIFSSGFFTGMSTLNPISWNYLSCGNYYFIFFRFRYIFLWFTMYFPFRVAFKLA